MTSSPTNIILDTDIGTDIDDAWALTMLLKSPELNPKLIVSAAADTTYRARIIAKMLQIAGRTDIPIGVGIPVPMPEAISTQQQWVADCNLENYPGPIHSDGVQAIINTIMESSEPITLISIGPLCNIAAALDREPAIASKARFVGMQGSLYCQYDRSPGRSAEWNVKHDIDACRKVFAADWIDATITPIDTCGLVQLTGDKYRAVAESTDPLTQALIQQYDNWMRFTKTNNADCSSTLYDTVAIYLAFASDLLVMQRTGVRVTDEGYTVPDPACRPMNCAVKWNDLKAFEDLLVDRLTN